MGSESIAKSSLKVVDFFKGVKLLVETLLAAKYSERTEYVVHSRNQNNRCLLKETLLKSPYCNYYIISKPSKNYSLL